MLRPSIETLEAFQAQLRPKWALILVLWLIAPRPRQHLPLPLSITSSIPATPSHFVSDLIPGGTPSIGLVEPPEESPLTAPYQRAAAMASSKDAESDGPAMTRVMPVKGSTSQDANSSKWYPTPPLSHPPPRKSPSPFTSAVLSNAPVPSPAEVDPIRVENARGERDLVEEAEGTTSDGGGGPHSGTVDAPSQSNHEGAPEAPTTARSNASPLAPQPCPIDYRGRPLCPDSTHVPLSIRERSSELADATSEFGEWVLASLHALILSLLKARLSPWMLFAVIIHVLLGVQLESLVLEEAIIRVGLMNPLPPDFPRAKSFAKRLSRMRWRARAGLSRYWSHAVGVFLLAAVVAVVVAECAWSRNEGWLDIPFGRWVLPASPVGGEEGRSSDSLRGMGPWRVLVILETVSALLSIFLPILHLLPHSIIPSTISPPSFVFPSIPTLESPAPFFNTAPPPSPSQPRAVRIELDTIWLLSLLIDASTSIVTLLQCVALVLALPSFSPLSLAPHILFHVGRAQISHITSLRTSMHRTVECLRTIFASFPEDAGDAGDAAEPDWICTICFEGAIPDEETPGSDGGSKTAKARCQLPCGHKYHAGCLAHWFHHQAWCPVCHQTPILPTVEMAPPPTPFAGRPHPTADEYPGNVARQRRRPPVVIGA